MFCVSCSMIHVRMGYNRSMAIRDTLSIIALLVLVAHMTIISPGDIIVPAAALAVSFLWLVLNARYDYVGKSRYLFGKVNVFALTVWAAAFVLTFDVHVFIFNQVFLLTFLAWIAAVIFGEWVGYHMLHIRIDGNGPGLLGFDIMHGTRILKTFYIISAPVFAWVMGLLIGSWGVL